MLKNGGQGSLNTEKIQAEKKKQQLLTKQRDYAHQELQRTISIEDKHTLDCFKNCGLLQLSTQTFAKNIIVNHSINGKNRRKSKGRRTKVKKKKLVRHLQQRDWTKLVTWTVDRCLQLNPVPFYVFVITHFLLYQCFFQRRNAKILNNILGPPLLP